MRSSITLFTIAILVVAALPVFAELQNVQVGGEVRLRGDYISNTYESAGAAVMQPGLQLRWPAGVLGKRSIGNLLSPPFGPNDVVSIFDWNDRGGDLKFVEQRTRVNVKAEFTDDVCAFIELDSYDIWGEDFRSANWITGADGRANSVDDVEMFQGYVEANEMFGQPLRLRVGRQEMAFGSQWLVGTGDFGFFFTGTSFDGIRLTYSTDLVSVDAWWSKLVERSPIEQDGDVDFYGVYASYKGIENISLDAYWMWVRDARSISDTQRGFLGEWAEEALGLDQYDVTGLHTVGLRGAGQAGGFDFDAEVSYQFGDAGQVGQFFRPGVYGDDDASFDAWGGRVEVGYTLDMKFSPRPFLGAIYFGGDDNRDISFGEWLLPWNRPEASVSFNRLFSNQIYSGFMDLNNDLSNAWIGRGGVVWNFTEKLVLWSCLSYFESLEAFDAPRHVTVGPFRVALAPNWSWWTQENDKDLGWETDLFFMYMYTADLTFEFGWAHLFTGNGLEQGNFSRWNGLLFNGGSDKDDADYVYLGTKIKF